MVAVSVSAPNWPTVKAGRVRSIYIDRARGSEHGASSRERGAKSEERRAKSEERRAKSKEQGAKVRHHCQHPELSRARRQSALTTPVILECTALNDESFPVLTERILGIEFFNGTPADAAEQMLREGGFLIAPSGTCFARLRRDQEYRTAVTRADLAIPDSGAMVLLWRILRGRCISRISGLKYLQHLTPKLFGQKAKLLWVLPNERAREKTISWLREEKVDFEESNFYVAPMYDLAVKDPKLVSKILHDRPDHVIVGIGSGPQEKLGYYLREGLTAAAANSFRPGLHCIGAALGFLTGEQVAIPDWADRFYLGWLFRLIAQPRIFVPRLARALELPGMILRYGEDLPPLRKI